MEETNREFRVELFEWTDPLVRACRDFVAFKDAIDMNNRAVGVYSLTFRKIRKFFGCYDDLKRGATAIMPFHFLQLAFPFTDSSKCIEEYQIKQIRPQLVLSGKYNTYNMSLCQEPCDVFPDIIMNGLGDACFEKSDGILKTETKYFKIGRLPLYVALEGKNRVSLYKEFRQCMFANVKTIYFPESYAMTLVKVKPFNVWMVEYCGCQKILPFSRVTLPVLRAYGVKKEKTQWGLSSLLKLRKQKKAAVNYQMRR
ncbi:hypothetical protein ACOA8Y_003705 [Serratia marcescens]|uniref:Uncharacterized protein n=1 Tax=Serratia marcescens TaxID=615 RepID=A0AAP8TWR6_SERMA|nr:hypothetical protein [Serratia marcescens]MBH3234717.1 hypothetical protein [Serratia marcescens]POP17007.1 hypothetical protein C3R40_09375 [Serratia marcescens]